MKAMIDHAPETDGELQREIFLLKAANAELADQNTFLQHMVKSQAVLAELQMQRIELFEGQLRPLGPRGQARLRRSAWWVRAWRRAATWVG